MCADILRNVSVYPFCATERTSLIIPQMSSVCQQQRKLIKTGVNLNFDYIKKVEWDYTLQTISRDASNDSYEITDGKGIILSANGNMYYNKPVVVMDKANNVLATIRKENSFLQIKYRIDLEGSTYIVEKALFCGNNTLFNIHLLNTKEIMYSISGNILSRKYKISKGKKVISLIQPEEKTKAYIKMAANVDTLLLLIVSVLVDLVDNDPIKF